MISSVTLKRFRGYREQTLELKPLTVLLGANSAGKSSFLHALAALHAIRMLRSTPATLLPRQDESPLWPLDFGSREQLQHEGTLDEGGVGIGIGTRDAYQREAGASYEFGRPGEAGLDLVAIEVDEGIPSSLARTAVYTVVAHEGALALGRVHEIPAPATPGTTSGRLQRSGERWLDADGTPVEVNFSNLELRNYLRGNTLAWSTSGRQREVLANVDRVRYLRAARARPRRKRPSRSRDLPDDYVGSAGQWTADTLDALQNTMAQFREPIPELITPGEAAGIVAGHRPHASEIRLGDAVQRWISTLGVAEEAHAERRDNDLQLLVSLSQGGTRRGLPDLGFGVSQLLPLLVQGLALPPDGTLLVEQPEAQLHPRPQALLADFFCGMVEAGRNVLVETHSEALFRRLHLHAMLDASLAAKIQVYFVDAHQGESCAVPKAVDLTARAGVTRWPEGFMHEGLNAQASYAAVRAVLSRKAPQA